MSLTEFLLSFSHGTVLIPILIIVFIWIDKPTVHQTIFLVFLSITINVALKVTFQIPLSPSLHKVGFAFPSGHMQLATVFYTYLAYKINNTAFRILIIPILAGVGFGLIDAGYHTLIDVLGGLFVGIFITIAYCLARYQWPKQLPLGVIVLASLCLLYIQIHCPPIPIHAWVAYLVIGLNHLSCRPSR